MKAGFHWADYPPLEDILKTNMAMYYQYSTEHCQSSEQHDFNQCLMEAVRDEAQRRGWIFPDNSDKVLRDRVRNYYKTHIQNAKKRLQTMLRNPTKKSNARHLTEHWDIIHGLTKPVSEEPSSAAYQLRRKAPNRPITFNDPKDKRRNSSGSSSSNGSVSSKKSNEDLATAGGENTGEI